MNKKIIMIAWFWLCLLAPNLLYPFMKNESDTGTDENRALADFPHLSLQTLESYPGEMDSYINDHAAFRNRFLSLNARLNLDLFDYPDSTEVLKGKDGWYFYTAGSSLADCLGINRYPEPVLQAITAHIQTAADYFESQGIQFIFVLPPSKESVYREYLPDSCRQLASPTRSEELISYIRTHSTVTVIDPAPYFAENRDYQWYFKTDTHWNDAAGYVTNQMLIEALGGAPVPIEDVTVSYLPSGVGDLGKLFHMPPSRTDDTMAVISGYYDELSTTREDVNGDGNITHQVTPDAPDPRRIAVYRDSFGYSLSQTLSKYFRYTDYYHWQAFDTSLLKENRPDVVVYEVVEREQGRIPEDMMKLAPEAFR